MSSLWIITQNHDEDEKMNQMKHICLFLSNVNTEQTRKQNYKCYDISNQNGDRDFYRILQRKV